MNISDEAVEAAISVFPWQAADYLDNDTVRAALEAAAPHMVREAKAEAWDECEAAKYLVMLKADGSGLTRVKTNPYRSQA